ncbi:MAG: glycosyltransferase [Luteibaculaceae bacterium]
MLSIPWQNLFQRDALTITFAVNQPKPYAFLFSFMVNQVSESNNYKTIVAVLVSNDLSTDQRVYKICQTLLALNLEPVLVGRLLPNSLPVDRPYKVIRLKLPFNSGPLFYAALNWNLIKALRPFKFSYVYANDLDTLLAGYNLAKKNKARLVYDSHEFFTEVPELIHRPLKQKIWQWLEKKLIYKANAVITVNQSIAQLFKAKYGILPQVMRNVPMGSAEIKNVDKAELGLLADKQYLILQGSGINVGRGAEELFQSMVLLPNNFVLLVVGSGDVLPKLKAMAAEENLGNRVIFKDKMPYAAMMQFTAHAFLGFSLDKPNSDNYLYSLPNKIFDYVKAKVPFVASNLPEPALVAKETGAGVLLSTVTPENIALTVQWLYNNPEKYAALKGKAEAFSNFYLWEKESKVIKKALGV